MDEKPDKDSNKDIIPDDPVVAEITAQLKKIKDIISDDLFESRRSEVTDYSKKIKDIISDELFESRLVESMLAELTAYYKQILVDILADTHTIKDPEASSLPYFARTKYHKSRSSIERRQSLVRDLNLDLRYLRAESISDISKVVDDNPIVYNRAMKVKTKIKELAYEVGVDPDDLISYIRDQRSRPDVEKKVKKRTIIRPIIGSLSRMGRPADPQVTLNRLLEKYSAAAVEFANASDAEKRLKLAYTLDNAVAGLKQRGYDTETLPFRDLVSEARTLKRSRSRRNAQTYG